MDESRLPVDDGRPDDTSTLWRGVPLSPSYIVPDGNSGTFKVSSGAFKDREMSVLVSEEATGLEDLTKGNDEYGVVAFTAGFARHAVGQQVAHDPWPNEPAHALVMGAKSPSVCRAFARNITWRQRPRGYDVHRLPDPSPSAESE
jgi:hypothetical protein